MGTPAFPNLGKHCSVEDCKQIDFLPFTCDCCHKVFCLDHRSYTKHQCPKANKNDKTVVICPLCAKGVLLIPEEDPNITWESHVNTECDPSNYEKATKRRKCPVRGCREVLTFSNTVKCRDCTIDHCLKHRFGLDHSCPGPKKPDQGLMGFFNRSPNVNPRWSSSWLSAATSFLSGEFGQKVKTEESSGGGVNNQVEQCPLCRARFKSGPDLVNHVQNVHKEKGLMKATVDVCPKCSRGFRDPLALVKHVEREHGGTSKA